MPDMNCTEFEARLNQLVEDHRSLEVDSSVPEAGIWRELRAQAHACPHCRRLWNEFALLERVLPLCKELGPPVDLVDAVIARWREESGSDRSPSSAPKSGPPANGNTRWIFPLFAVIAATVLACFAFLFRPDPSDDHLPGTVPVATIGDEPDQSEFENATSHESTDIDAEPELELNWQAMAQDAGSAYWVLASETADSFTTVAVLAPPLKRSAEKPRPTPETNTRSGWSTGIGAGLKPIREDVGKAMGFLFDALPGEKTL